MSKLPFFLLAFDAASAFSYLARTLHCMCAGIRSFLDRGGAQ